MPKQAYIMSFCDSPALTQNERGAIQCKPFNQMKSQTLLSMLWNVRLAAADVMRHGLLKISAKVHNWEKIRSSLQSVVSGHFVLLQAEKKPERCPPCVGDEAMEKFGMTPELVRRLLLFPNYFELCSVPPSQHSDPAVALGLEQTHQENCTNRSTLRDN